MRKSFGRNSVPSERLRAQPAILYYRVWGSGRKPGEITGICHEIKANRRRHSNPAEGTARTPTFPGLGAVQVARLRGLADSRLVISAAMAGAMAGFPAAARSPVAASTPACDPKLWPVPSGPPKRTPGTALRSYKHSYSPGKDRQI